MGITVNSPNYMSSIIHDIANVVENASIQQNKAHSGTDRLMSQSLVTNSEKMGNSDYMVAFSGQAKSYCVGIVDMIDSTKISANMHERDWCKYYTIFLNSMSKILSRFGGAAIKNGGDSLLYYFPESSKTKSKFGFISCLECSIAMTESHDLIAEFVKKEALPPLNYRVSADYGKVVMMNSNYSSNIDVIGPPVNMCAKINHLADKNRTVIGGDLYEMVKNVDYDYIFKQEKGFSIGLRYSYPIYSVGRKEK